MVTFVGGATGYNELTLFGNYREMSVMRKTCGLLLGMALLVGCSDSPDAKKANQDAKQAADKMGQEVKEAAEAVGDAAVKGTEALGKELQDVGEKAREGINEATDKAKEPPTP